MWFTKLAAIISIHECIISHRKLSFAYHTGFDFMLVCFQKAIMQSLDIISRYFSWLWFSYNHFWLAALHGAFREAKYKLVCVFRATSIYLIKSVFCWTRDIIHYIENSIHYIENNWMNSCVKTEGEKQKQFITWNNKSEQIIKLTHPIHVCLITFLIHYFDLMSPLKSDTTY